MLYTSPWSRFELTTSVVIGTDCIGSCKSNYHRITTMTAPRNIIGTNHMQYYWIHTKPVFMACHWLCSKSNTTGATHGTGTANRPEHLSSHPDCSEVRVTRSLVFYVVLCRSLFIRLFSFVCPLCCLSFDLQLMITPLVSSNFYSLLLHHVLSYWSSQIVWYFVNWSCEFQCNMIKTKILVSWFRQL